MTHSPNILPHIHGVIEGMSLSRDDMRVVLRAILNEPVDPVLIAALLVGLRMKGETAQEMAGAVDEMRAAMVPVTAPFGAIDIVGTGGDGVGTYNISTASAFVLAGGGVCVAKHGNRALSSKSGAADVLSALGVRLDLSPEQISRCLEDTNIGFMFAPQHHPATRAVQGVRQKLKVRTMFNVLGPMCNPAGVGRMVFGVYDPALMNVLADALLALRMEHVILVHGAGGIDEFSPTGQNQCVELRGGAIRHYTLSPEDFGLAPSSLDDLIGGDAAFNARALRRLLEGEPSAYGDAVLMNAAAGFVVAGRVDDFLSGVQLARASISSGQALQALDYLAALSRTFAT